MKTIIFLIFAAFVITLPLVKCATNAKGLEFLEKNKGKEGVVTLKSGMQYKVLKKGNGDYHPLVGTSCECHYEGTLIDGTVFDSSYARGSPTSFAPNQVIKGWTEAMQLMTEGDKWELYIPSELAYGDRGSPPKIGGGEVLIFTIEILKINGEKKLAFKCNHESLEKCDEKGKKYISKVLKKYDHDGVLKEIERLEKLKEKPLKSELKVWISKRLIILRHIKDTEVCKLN